jgi:hypothetical protein
VQKKTQTKVSSSRYSSGEVQLVSDAGLGTKPSKHWHLPSVLSHMVVAVSQPCEPSSQGCEVGMCVGNRVSAEGAAVGDVTKCSANAAALTCNGM